MKRIILLCICDQFKTRDSMRVIGVVKNLEIVRSIVEELLKNNIIGDSNTKYELDSYETINDFNQIDYFYIRAFDIDDVFVDGNYY